MRITQRLRAGISCPARSRISAPRPTARERVRVRRLDAKRQPGRGGQLVAPLLAVVHAAPALPAHAARRPTSCRTLRHARTSPAKPASPATTRIRRTGVRRRWSSAAASPGSATRSSAPSTIAPMAGGVDAAWSRGRHYVTFGGGCGSAAFRHVRPAGRARACSRSPGRRPDRTSPTSCSASRTAARSRSATPTSSCADRSSSATSTTTGASRRR